MKKKTPLEYGKYFHVYNRGNNKQAIFFETKDYLHFLELVSIFISPIADIYAYALMGNHFHFLIRIKDEEEIGYLNPLNAESEELDKKWKIFETIPPDLSKKQWKRPIPQNMFQHLFNAYARFVNTKYKRIGHLFEKNFERKLVSDEMYLKALILYIHNNPVKHGFCESPVEYPWTSYLSLVSIKPTRLQRKQVIGWFDNKANFIAVHQNYSDDFDDIQAFLMDDE